MNTHSKNDDLGTTGVIWNLDHLYQDVRDPRIQEDMDRWTAVGREIGERYTGKVASLSSAELLKAVARLEELAAGLGRLWAYAQLNFSTRVNHPPSGGLLQRVKECASLVQKEVVFFDLEWAAVPDAQARALLDDPVLSPYRHYLEAARRYRPHLLSHIEERLLAEISPVGRSSWITLFEKMHGAKRYGEAARTQEDVLADLYSPLRDVRRKAAEELTAGLRGDLHVLAHTFNTILAEKMIEDRMRRYPQWISAMNLANELDDDTVNGLVDAVTARYGMVERYYSLKRRILGLDELCDYDRYAPVPYVPEQILDWAACRRQVLRAFEAFSPEMAAVAERFFDEGWIHAPVLPGKKGGAFAHPTIPQVHPYVLVNYTGNFRDVETVAHELGHGVHQVLAARSGYFNSDTPLTLAETASVFGEMLVFKDLMSDIQEPGERLGLICAKIESVFATVFRQIAMNRFEEGIHTARRNGGELSEADFSRLWMETQKTMFGSSVTLTEGYAVWWAYIGHFLHSPGYVYAYAFGELLVFALYSLHEQGHPDFVRKYLALLEAGGSDTPYVLLAPFGLDLRDPGFWHRGLDVIEAMVREAEELALRI